MLGEGGQRGGAINKLQRSLFLETKKLVCHHNSIMVPYALTDKSN